MSFYLQPSFFILLAAAVVPAAVLGFAGRRIKYYGLAASVFFLALLFGSDLQGFLAFAFFVALAFAVTRWEFASWQSGQKSMAKYRVALMAVIAPLVVYKVGAVFDQNLLGFIGISYITFKAVQVVLEIRDGLIKEMSPFDYLYFLLFFAPFTSGPIDRSRRFSADANRTYTAAEYADLLSRGILLLLAGACYQMVFGTICHHFYTPEAFSADYSLLHNVGAAWKDAFAYGFYLFFDFAGYSMMAMGASYCFGIKTPRNFRAPFIAKDVKEFWDRWHMTLSFWLRDFVFMRFVRSATRHKWFKTRLTTACVGYILDFALMGVWHGITADYIVYGFFYGFLLAGTDIYQKKCPFHKKHKGDWWYKLVCWAVTINLVMFAMSIFSGQAHLIVSGLVHG